MELPVIKNYLTALDSLNGFFLMRNPLTTQMLDDYNRTKPKVEEFDIVDIMTNFNQKTEFKNFLKRRHHYQEYFDWLEYRLTQSLFGTMEQLGAGIYSDINAAQMNMETPGKNFGDIFKVLADQFTRIKIHKSYEQMYNTTSFRFTPDTDSMVYQFNTIGLMTSGEYHQLYWYALSKVTDEESINQFGSYVKQLREELKIKPKDETFNYVLSKMDFELTKVVFDSIIRGGKNIDLGNCNLYMGVVNLDRKLNLN
ncbi:MAG: hypothetical protein JNM93_04260 [Bacteriovoracaceae bacterium]|nr:hypothetical protein [Bacteriovoracaceae bacterium]